jgi:hypothetical protein
MMEFYFKKFINTLEENMKFLITLSVLFSCTAFAQYQKTPFDTIREAFNAAPEPACVDDFDMTLWKACVFVDVSCPTITRETTVRVLHVDSQDHGPLFPGGSDKRVDVFSDTTIDQRLYSFFASSYIEQNDTYFRQVLDGPEWAHVNITAKKQEGMLLFAVDYGQYPGPNSPMYTRFYGYCWSGENGGEPPLPKPR